MKLKVGRILADRRQAVILSQQELADAVGVALRTVARWEGGTVAAVHPRNARALREALKLGELEFRQLFVAGFDIGRIAGRAVESASGGIPASEQPATSIQLPVPPGGIRHGAELTLSGIAADLLLPIHFQTINHAETPKELGNALRGIAKQVEKIEMPQKAAARSVPVRTRQPRPDEPPTDPDTGKPTKR